MGLLDRLQSPIDSRAGSQPSLYAEARGAAGAGFLGELRARVQARLVERVDASKLEEVGYGGLLERIGEVINELIAEDKILLTAADRDRLIDSITNDMLGLGPLEPLLQDNSISDILV